MEPREHGRDPSVGPWERVAAVAVVVEAAMVAFGTIAMVVGWFVGWDAVSAGTVFVVAFGAALSAGLVVVARALARGARWPLGAALTWQVLQAAVALGSTGSRWWLVALIVLPVPFALGGILAGALRTGRTERAAAARDVRS